MNFLELWRSGYVLPAYIQNKKDWNQSACRFKKSNLKLYATYRPISRIRRIETYFGVSSGLIWLILPAYIQNKKDWNLGEYAGLATDDLSYRPISRIRRIETLVGFGPNVFKPILPAYIQNKKDWNTKYQVGQRT